MSEDRGLGTSEKIRIESLSDLIFGLALSIGSLVLIAKIPTSPNQLTSDVVQFAFSFLILVIIWTIYTRIVNFLAIETDIALVLNIMLLFTVAIEPFLFYVVVSSSAFEEYATSVYAIDIGLMYFTLFGMITVAMSQLRRKRVNLPLNQLKALSRRRMVQLLGGSLFFVSALPYFWVKVPVGGYLRLDLWIAGFLTFLIFRAWQKVSR
ncbi:MAG: TMEM175 family protein [Conexivisphaerales archaeon]